MSAQFSLFDATAVAQAVAGALPSSAPIQPRLAQPGPVLEFTTAHPQMVHVAVDRIGSVSVRAMVAVTPELLAPWQDMPEAPQPERALTVILESAMGAVGEGVTTDLPTTPNQFLQSSPTTFLLQTNSETYGWFALNFQEVKHVFDEQVSTDPTTAAQQVTDQQATSSASTKPLDPAQRAHAMRMLYDVEMTLTAEIGRAKMPVRQLLDLTPGTIVELDRVAGSPADLMVNGHLVAKGEVVVVDEEYGLRITEILDPEGML